MGAREVIAGINKEIDDLKAQIEVLEEISMSVIREAVVEVLGKETTVSPTDIVIGDDCWPCKEEKNPSYFCLYNDKEDVAHDRCLFLRQT